MGIPTRMVLPLVVLLACAPVREEITLNQVCVVANAGLTLVADQPVRLTIGVDPSQTCRRPCDNLVSQSCTVRREGNTLRIHGHITVEVDCPGGDFPPVCSAPLVECTSEPLPEGDYVLTDGTRELRFHVPSDVPRFRACAS